MMSREEYVQGCRARALAHLEAGGEVADAWSAFAREMDARDDTRHHPCLAGAPMLRSVGWLTTPDELERYLEGFVDPAYAYMYALPATG